MPSQCQNHVKRAILNILNGTFAGAIEFTPNLNILSGENGTLKTKVLQAIKQGGPSILTLNPASPVRVLAISPKRNAERRAFENIVSTFRQQNRTLEILFNERAGVQINDATFDNYPSIGDLFYLVFEDRCKDGGDRRDRMSAVANEFNEVIQRIFDRNQLVAVWNEQTGAPSIRIRKGSGVEFPIEGLSLGEQEILSLVTNLFSSRERYDSFLIDEPEVHLNWHLEEQLFSYLADFCNQYAKQIIVATHSRAIFKSRFLAATQFLTWTSGGNVACVRDLTDDQRRRIAGDAIEIIKLGQSTHPAFFVEDNCHREILEQLASILSSPVTISTCGNSSNVRSLFKLSRSEGGWRNSFFLTDGDNEGDPFPDDLEFIHLDQYCIENYLLDISVIAELCSKTFQEVQKTILDAILDKRHQIFSKNQFFEFLADSLRPEHITQDRLTKLDASEILDALLPMLSFNRKSFIQAYLLKANELGRLKEIFPDRLIQAIKGSGSSPTK
jgi:hypothetical protein